MRSEVPQELDPQVSLPDGPRHRCPTEPAPACLVPTVPGSCGCWSEQGLPVQEEDSTVPLAFREASVPTRAKPLFFSYTKPPGLAASSGLPPLPPSQTAPLSPPTRQSSLTLCNLQALPNKVPVPSSEHRGRTAGEIGEVGEGRGSCAGGWGGGAGRLVGPAHSGLLP